jgi:hypothetical protein
MSNEAREGINKYWSSRVEHLTDQNLTDEHLTNEHLTNNLLAHQQLGDQHPTINISLTEAGQVIIDLQQGQESTMATHSGNFR